LVVVSFVDWTESIEDTSPIYQSDEDEGEEEVINHVYQSEEIVRPVRESVGHNRSVSTSPLSGSHRQQEHFRGAVLSADDGGQERIEQGDLLERTQAVLYSAISPAIEIGRTETLTSSGPSPSISNTMDNYNTPTELALRDEPQNSTGLFPLARAEALLVRHFFQTLAAWVSVLLAVKLHNAHYMSSLTTATCDVSSPPKYLED
jgi:hypothetical protein